jgi:hypothetical protein
MIFSSFDKRRLLAGMVLLTSALLASCGGGDQKETFHARRVVVFGDRASYVDVAGNGAKYTVNADTVACNTNTVWVQVVAAGYGISLCPATPGAATPAALMRAGPDDTVALVKAKIDAYLASDSPAKTDLVTIYVGVNDVIGQYQANGEDLATAPQEAAMFEAVRAAGTELGTQVMRITATGAKVVVLTLPDLSLTPYGREEPLPGPNRLNRLSVAFNDNLRLKLGSDPNGGGRSGALVEAYDLITLFTLNQNNQFGTLTTKDKAACGAVAEADLLTGCTVAHAATITGGESYTTWLWASKLQLSPRGHELLGSQALTRLRNNPL